jgi:6-phosphogluconate dehydrogenase
VIRAVVFDLDGTLVQTEALKAISYARAARQLKPSLDEDQIIARYDDMIGRSRNEVAEALVERLGLDVTWQQLIDIRMKMYDAMLADENLVKKQEYPHATALLRKVKGMGYPTGLCTMSYAPETAVVLKTLDIGRYLDVVVTRDQVSKPKPDPEIYRLAASKLNVQPAECLVIEDSEPGVASAIAAGTQCVVVPSELTRDRVLSHAPLAGEVIVNDPADLDRVVTNLLRGSRTMQLGMIGLGKMGANMTTRLVKGGHTVVVYDRDAKAVTTSAGGGATASSSLADLVSKLKQPRAIWIMVPAGDPTEATVRDLSNVLAKGDTIIDGGNSNYKDDIRRQKDLEPKGIYYVDAGTSGGIWGLKEGYSLMIGGDEAAVERLRPIFETLAPSKTQGWARMGPTGSGHFVKMVHNGIEYGLMQAYAEGFAIMQAKKEFGLDVAKIAEVWRYGSVVRSWLLDLAAIALKENPTLKGIAPYVVDSGEGRWTVAEAIDLDVPAPIITQSLIERLRSRDDDSYTDKMLAALRNQFGGHAIKTEATS